jgi:nucleolar protein 12
MYVHGFLSTNKNSKGMASGKSSLASLFSEENKANYERINKPKEFVKTERKKRRLEESNDENQEVEEVLEEILPKKVKKPKYKKRNQQAKESADDKPTTSETEPNVEEEGHEKNARTIFVGNIPITETVTSIRTYFGQFGQVESVRLRSVPTAGTAVNEAGNQNLVKKVCVYQGKFGDQKGSFNAYVVFKSTGSVQASLAANNRLMGTRHIRVDSMNPTLFPPKTSVFLGGLPFYTDEEELREHFAKVCSLFLSPLTSSSFFPMVKTILLAFV